MLGEHALIFEERSFYNPQLIDEVTESNILFVKKGAD
jgi:hypothetical protein